MVRIIVRVLGVLAILLGGLWLLQGLGLVTIPPILCVAECAPLEGPSTGWAIAGLMLAVIGIVGLLGEPPPPRLTGARRRGACVWWPFPL